MTIEVMAKRNFGGVDLRIIQAEEADSTFWLSGEEIGMALELEEPRIAINKIYQRHQDELEQFSMLWTVETPGGPQEVRIFSEEAVYMITFFSQSQKAKEFRRWVAGLIKAYRQGKLGPVPNAREQIEWMRTQRLFMKEQRKFHEYARAETERILREEGTLQELDQVPLIQEAVKAILEGDPRAKQLKLFS